MEIVAYLRTSTESQEEGLETQRSEIQAWADREGHTIVGWFVDEGKSGSEGLDTRTGLATALCANSQALVVYKLDRLARDLVIQETVLSEAKRVGMKVFSTMAGESEYLVDDLNDPTRKLIRQILGAIGDYDRAMIRLRMKAGADRKKAGGGYGGGGVPFGYRVNPLTHDLEADPREQEALALMVSLKGSESLRGIARRLDEAGLAPRKGKSWHPHSVGRCLARSGLGGS